MEDLAAFTAAEVEDSPDDVRESVRDSVLIARVDGSDVVDSPS
jgi:hypothetical protein